MTVASRFDLAVICLLTLSAGLGTAQDNVDQLLNDIDRLKTKFVKDKAAEKKKVLDNFDTAITRVTNSTKMKAADRLAAADRLKAERDLFAKKEDLPESAELAQYGWKYGIALVKIYGPLSKTFDKAMDLSIKNGDLTLAKKLKTDKEKFDDLHLPGRRCFTAGAYYLGTRYDVNGAARPYSLRVNELKGELFKARLEDNLQFAGHGIFDATGSLDGIHVVGGSVKVVQGGNPKDLKKWEGVVLGETLILEFTSVSPKGQVFISDAVLRRR